MKYTKLKNYSLCILLLLLPVWAKAQRSIEFTWQKEQEYRAGKRYTEEKHYKKGKLHGVYKKLDATDNVVTKGCYVVGKRHGKWREMITMYGTYHYIQYTYRYGTLKKIYEYKGWGEKKDSIKYVTRWYNLTPDTRNYTMHEILWDVKYLGKKNEEEIYIVKKGITVYHKIKRWDKGIPWEIEEKKALYDQNGNSLGLKKHGYWAIWNEDGTLQKETWYDMGKLLRQKRYEGGKLVEDKKYSKLRR
ncbi:hypothetical protein [uncultured Microscilla sp.]|uniref:hypothetical protein n=1 Tax=uncultured Microscilla sp. TaxID=432653 RepID=UPI002614C0A4|nr:hypothetical protein [uncultured Microscilla sp.]